MGINKRLYYRGREEKHKASGRERRHGDRLRLGERTQSEWRLDDRALHDGRARVGSCSAQAARHDAGRPAPVAPPLDELISRRLWRRWDPVDGLLIAGRHWKPSAVPCHRQRLTTLLESRRECSVFREH